MKQVRVSALRCHAEILSNLMTCVTYCSRNCSRNTDSRAFPSYLMPPFIYACH